MHWKLSYFSSQHRTLNKYIFRYFFLFVYKLEVLLVWRPQDLVRRISRNVGCCSIIHKDIPRSINYKHAISNTMQYCIDLIFFLRNMFLFITNVFHKVHGRLLHLLHILLLLFHIPQNINNGLSCFL